MDACSCNLCIFIIVFENVHRTIRPASLDLAIFLHVTSSPKYSGLVQYEGEAAAAANPSHGKAALYDKTKLSDRSRSTRRSIDRAGVREKKSSIVDRVTNSDIGCSDRDELGRAVNKACGSRWKQEAIG